MRFTFYSLFNDVVRTYGSDVLLYDTVKSRGLSYNDSLSLTEMISGRLAASDIRKGDVIVSYCPLSIESVLLCWASLRSACVFLPVDHNWPGHLLNQVLEETQPSFLITDREGFKTSEKLFPQSKTLLSGTVFENSPEPLFSWIERGPFIEGHIESTPSPDDIAVLLYTSGSTGQPKGVALSQHAVCTSGKLVAEFFEWERGDTFMNLGDLHSMSGLRNTCIAPLFQGSSMIIAKEEERNAVLHIIDLVHTLNIQYIGIAPTLIRQLNLLYSDVRKEQLSPLKALLCTAGHLPKDQLAEFYKKYGIPVFNYYGLTETAGICSGHNASTFSLDDNSIGIPVGAEFILLPEEGYEDPDTGLLLVSSDHLMTGYYMREEETARVLSREGFNTGDIVRRRQDGCYELLGRKKNFVKSIHAELIHLEEVDQALELFPSILEACACSYAEHAEDEKIVAFIVPADRNQEEAGLIEKLKAHMAAMVGKKRSPWCYFIKNELPRNTPGKIERQKLTAEIDGLIQSEHTRYF